jgi:pimeloyl-ACP methyl ester carboxylesterase
LTDGFAQDREVILFNNPGVSSFGGEVPTSIEEMAQHVTAFIDALGIEKLDAFGFSIGGLVAQRFTIDRPDLVQKLILVGTGPNEWPVASLTPEAQEIFGAEYDPADELWLRVFFTPSAAFGTWGSAEIPSPQKSAPRRFRSRLASTRELLTLPPRQTSMILWGFCAHGQVRRQR